MNELTKSPGNLLALKQVQGFQKVLNKEPQKKHIKTNPYAGNSLYIPIGVIENQLDEHYSGLWQHTAKFEMMGNSIVCTLHLRVFHPVAGVWLTRCGVGAIPVQLNAGEKDMNFANVKSDAFKKGCGAAKSEALNNAAKSLGQVFGRNLNRKDLDDYEYYDAQNLQTDDLATQAAVMLERATTLPDNQREAMKKKIAKGNAKTLQEIINYLQVYQPEI